MAKLLSPQDPPIPKPEKYTEEPIQKRYGLEWATNLSNTKRRRENDNTALITFLIVIIVCVILAMWIFGRTSSPSSDGATSKTNEPPSGQSENDTTKPDMPSLENSKPTTSAPDIPTQTEKPITQAPSGSSGSTPSYGNVCIHYEYGRCWDDLEDEAYDAGRWDGSYGSYGNSYYESDDCDDLCQSIMEDAYDEGYYDY